ncbi:HpcH/HpaI aldolase/citrate lyase family protein [Parafrigoribacterium soli]|uniref:HpcH/HpaI aldolase/citrate lyase family protein n=1 Tax=Parafrigoribacterium soli TaxID=3144663 RepID=UPI0032EF295E
MTFELGPALLFCPADRPDRYEKAAERADAVILDLEDAVGASRKAAARDAMIAHPLDPDTTIVRVNAFTSGYFADDLMALGQTGYRTIMVAKAEEPEQLSGLDRYSVIALCETARGVLAAPALAAAKNVVALMWGAEDLVASLGGNSTRFDDGRYRHIADHARSSILIAAGASSKAAIDTVHLDIADLDGLAGEAADAAAVGFAATACIHPDQVAIVREAYRPTPAQVALARELLDAAASQRGVFRFRGQMVDGPVLRHAEKVVQRGES